MKDKLMEKICQFCEEPIKDEDLGGMYKIKGKMVFFHYFTQCLLALKIQLEMDENSELEIAFHIDRCERCGSDHKTKDCIKNHLRISYEKK